MKHSKATAGVVDDQYGAGETTEERPPVVMVDGRIAFDVDAIKDYVMCSLCHGVYREPYTTIKCFHTFCKSCLVITLHAQKFNRALKNMCPAVGCQEYFGGDADISKIALADRTLQTVIDKVLFRDLAQEDEEAEEAFYRSRGIPKKDSVKRSSGMDDNAEGADVTLSTANITFQLLPANDDSSPLPRPVLEADGAIRVKQLKQFIAHELHLDIASTTATIQVLCDDVPLGDELSVVFVKKSVWMEQGKIMTLRYHIVAS